MNVSKILKSGLLALPLLTTTLSYAQEDAAEHTVTPAWEWSVSLGSMNIDSESAANEAIGDSTDFVLGFSADYSTQRWITSIGLDWVSYDDKAGFSQRTENQFGREDDSSSDATGLLFYGAFGPQWRFGQEQKTSVFLQAGLSTMFSSERSIDYCTDCYSEDIDIEGGVFARAGFMQKVGNTMALGLNFTQYLRSDDLENGFNIILRWSPNS